MFTGSHRLFWLGLFFASTALGEITPASLNMPTTSQAAYHFVDAFPELTFNDPITITRFPDDPTRLLIGEKGGKIWLIPDLTMPTQELFLDLATLHNIPNVWEAGLLGVALHPDYASNGYFYIFYTPENEGDVRRNRVSRFQVSAENENLADDTSELILINQWDATQPFHDAGDLHFGPDGYLYFTIGDHGGADDQFNVAQRLDHEYFAGLFRIDVDKRPENLEPNDHPSVYRAAPGDLANYSVPADNPWVGATSFNGLLVDPDEVIMEYFSIGLRNPYRFSIDEVSGQIWIGDVGQYAQEEINIASGGENFGWAYREGTLDGPKSSEAPEGFVETPPVFTYPRDQGRAVVGGLVYYGALYPELSGAYIFADYVSGNVWALQESEGNYVAEFLTQKASLTEFDRHPITGDILASVRNENRVLKLVRTEVDDALLPETLSATGAYNSVVELTPAAGVVPYAANLSFWSDHAIKQRWVALPGATPFGYSLNEPWSAPTGAVWVKHFDLLMDRRDPDTRQRVETRFLVKTDAGAYGVTYVWNEAQTEATLAPTDGLNLPFDIIDENGISKTQTWRIPSRSECMQCHTSASGYALSFNARQLNRTATLNETEQNLLVALTEMGYLEGGPSADETPYIPAYAEPDDLTQSLEYRARSYLAVNCAPCHQPGGPALGSFDLRAQLTLRETGLINAMPGNDAGGNGNPNNRIIAPGQPALSVLLQRMCACEGFSRMPPLASNEIDEVGVGLIRDWIGSLAGYQTYEAWVEAYFEDPDSPEALPSVDFDQDGQSNEFEFLAKRDPTSYADAWRPTWTVDGDQWRLSYTVVPDLPLMIETSEDLVDWTVWDQGPQSLIYPTEETAEQVDFVMDGTRFLRFVFPTVVNP